MSTKTQSQNVSRFNVFLNAGGIGGVTPWAMNIPFDTRVFDTLREVNLLAVPPAFTASRAGFYFVAAQMTLILPAGNTLLGISIVNAGGVAVCQTINFSQVIAACSVFTSTITYLQAGQSLHVVGAAQSGGAAVTMIIGADLTFFCGHRLS